jgi:hypothetical protein
MTRRGGGPWYGRDRDCILFDGPARAFPGLRVIKSKGRRTYRLRLDVPYYEPRNVEIRFENWSRVPSIFVDGPSSPHRYKEDGDCLCIWDPRDPLEQRWVFQDGLLALINHIQAHLFREAWWRETGEWLGPEAPHSRVKEPVSQETIDERARPDSGPP